MKKNLVWSTLKLTSNMEVSASPSPWLRICSEKEGWGQLSLSRILGPPGSGEEGAWRTDIKSHFDQLVLFGASSQLSGTSAIIAICMLGKGGQLWVLGEPL